MLQRKYQIFISSTYKDLEKERGEVIKAILKSNNFPIGMEMFHADDEEQWMQISRTIDMSDFYVLILGKCCGTVITKENRSYTEKEYDYAISKGIPVLAFVIDDNAQVTYYEETQKQRKIYKKFKNKVEKLPRETWTNKEELALKVINTLYTKIAENKRNGWIRYKPELMSEISSIPSTVTGEYTLVYLSAMNSDNRKLIYSTLSIEKNGQVIFKNNINVKDGAGAEFTYKGFCVVEGNVVNIRLKNDNSNERITIELMSSVGDLKRYIGLLLGLSADGIPSCVKIACYDEQLSKKINTDALLDILDKNNEVFNKNVTTVEDKEKIMFFSDRIFKN